MAAILKESTPEIKSSLNLLEALVRMQRKYAQDAEYPYYRAQLTLPHVASSSVFREPGPAKISRFSPSRLKVRNVYYLSSMTCMTNEHTHNPPPYSWRTSQVVVGVIPPSRRDAQRCRPLGSR